MANGTYAMNMEIEMLKKELAQEGDRLRRIQNGEKVSPPRVSSEFWLASHSDWSNGYKGFWRKNEVAVEVHVVAIVVVVEIVVEGADHVIVAEEKIEVEEMIVEDVTIVDDETIEEVVETIMNLGCDHVMMIMSSEWNHVTMKNNQGKDITQYWIVINTTFSGSDRGGDRDRRDDRSSRRDDRSDRGSDRRDDRGDRDRRGDRDDRGGDRDRRDDRDRPRSSRH